MPIPLPNLDDRTYAELTAEARSLIPSACPAWTNHNPSDPGIVLIEMLAWLTEMLLFQVNEIPAANTDTFLRLLNGPRWTRPDSISVDVAVRQTMRDLRERYRAVTPEDFEYLALHTWSQSAEAATLGQIRRVRCVPRRDLSASDPVRRAAPAPAHVSVVVMPEPRTDDQGHPVEDYPALSEPLRAGLHTFLEARRTLTTRHHVVGPRYVDITIGARLALHEDALTVEAATNALAQSREALRAFFHPLSGGAEQQGWPFGRAVYTSEVYAALERVPSVNYVEEVTLTGPRPPTTEGGQTVGIELDGDELVKLGTLDLMAYDVHGHEYR